MSRRTAATAASPTRPFSEWAAGAACTTCRGTWDQVPPYGPGEPWDVEDGQEWDEGVPGPGTAGMVAGSYEEFAEQLGITAEKYFDMAVESNVDSAAQDGDGA